MNLKLYKISQDINNGYDTYDAAIVCASSEDEARHLHPRLGGLIADSRAHTLVTLSQINSVNVEYIGEASPNLDRPQVILASYNAG